MASDTFCAWTRTGDEVLEHWKSDVEQGLGDAEVQRRREIFGWNELEKEEKKPLWKLILEQFEDALVRVREGSDRERKGKAMDWDRTRRTGDEVMQADTRTRCTPSNTSLSIETDPLRVCIGNDG